MRNQIVTTYDNKYSEDLFNPPVRWYGFGVNVLTADDPKSSKKELEQLYIEAHEYDFLMGKRPKILPDYRQEED